MSVNTMPIEENGCAFSTGDPPYERDLSRLLCGYSGEVASIGAIRDYLEEREHPLLPLFQPEVLHYHDGTPRGLTCRLLLADGAVSIRGGAPSRPERLRSLWVALTYENTYKRPEVCDFYAFIRFSTPSARQEFKTAMIPIFWNSSSGFFGTSNAKLSNVQAKRLHHWATRGCFQACGGPLRTS